MGGAVRVRRGVPREGEGIDASLVSSSGREVGRGTVSVGEGARAGAGRVRASRAHQPEVGHPPLPDRVRGVGHVVVELVEGLDDLVLFERLRHAQLLLEHLLRQQAVEEVVAI